MTASPGRTPARTVSRAFPSVTTSLRVRGRTPVPPLPRVELELVRPVTGWVVRLLPAVLVAACAVLLDRGPVVWGLAALAAGLLTWRPVLPVAPFTAVVVGALVYGAGDQVTGVAVPGAAAAGNDGLLRLSGLVLCLHLLLRASGLAAHVSWRSAVEGPVLARLARSLLGAQLVAQALLLGLASLSPAGPDAGREWLRVVAVVAVVLVVVLVVPRAWVTRRPRPRGF